jgi:leucyl-tRNA synthetase
MSKCEFQIRYQKQLGKNVLFPFAFHCTGMPIHAAARRLRREIESGKTKREEGQALTQFEILKQIGISDEEIPKFVDPKYWLEFFPPQGQQDLKEFGVFVDWRRSFITTEVNPFYDSFIRWQFNTLKAAEKVKFGKRYTIFSPLDGQPCADHDRSKGEGVGPQEYTLIKIQCLELPASLQEKFAGKKVYLVAATLRPETMYGQTNCYVLAEGEYGVFEMKNDEYFICSHRAARNLAYQEMTKEFGKYPCLADVKGQDLIGLPLKAPLSSYEVVYALPMLTISMGKGTGIVTSVPSDSPDDWAALRDLQTKKGLREKYNIKDEWCMPFEPKPIINIPEFGNLTAVKLVDELKI